MLKPSHPAMLSRSPWTLFLLPLLWSCGDDGGNGSGSLTPTGDWELVTKRLSCTSAGSLGIDAEDRPLLLCMLPRSEIVGEFAAISTWDGEELVTEPLEYLTLIPFACDRLVQRPGRPLGARCQASSGAYLGEWDGPRGAWIGPDRPRAASDTLLGMAPSGGTYGTTVLGRDAAGMGWIREWRGGWDGDGAHLWQPPEALTSTRVGAADLTFLLHGWLVAYADEAAGGRLRLESSLNGSRSDDPDLTAGAVDRVTLRADTFGVPDPSVWIAFCAEDGSLQALGGQLSALGPPVEVAAGPVGEVALGVSAFNHLPQLAFTDPAADGALKVTWREGGSWVPPVQVSPGAASGIASDSGGRAVSFCDESDPIHRARVFLADQTASQDLELPIEEPCLETQLAGHGSNELLVAVLISDGDGRAARLAHRDQYGAWTDLGGGPLPGDASGIRLAWLDNGSQTELGIVALGVQGTAEAGNGSEPLVYRLGSGRWIFVEQLGHYDKECLAQGPDGRLFVSNQWNDLGQTDGTLEVRRLEPDGQWTSFGLALGADEDWSGPLLTVAPDGAPVIAAAILEGDQQQTLVKRWVDDGAGAGDWEVIATGEDMAPSGLLVPSDGRVLLAVTLAIPAEPGSDQSTLTNIALYQEPEVGTEWLDLGRPDPLVGERRNALSLAFVEDDEVMLVYQEYLNPYERMILHSRLQPGRGWEAAQLFLGASGDVYSHLEPGAPLVVRASDGTLWGHFHTSYVIDVESFMEDRIGRWVPRP